MSLRTADYPSTRLAVPSVITPAITFVIGQEAISTAAEEHAAEIQRVEAKAERAASVQEQWMREALEVRLHGHAPRLAEPDMLS